MADDLEQLSSRGRRLGGGGQSARAPWSQAQAERHLRSLELFGMRFGLDRMRRMMTVLGSPERRFDTIHVVGTNGKSSTTRMTAAILERHGLRTGAYTSPHLISYTERVQVGERDLDSDAFAAAIARAAWAAERVNRTLAGDDHVTQFELLTAAALWEMARQEVEVAVVEAGLGRALRRHQRRVLAGDRAHQRGARAHALAGADDQGHRRREARRARARHDAGAGRRPGERGARGGSKRGGGAPGAHRVRVAARPAGWPLLARGAFQQRNFALARAAAEAYLRGGSSATRVARVHERPCAPRPLRWRGGLQLVEGDPPIVLDGAHNPDAVAALVESLPAVLGERPVALVLGVLEDKDAARMLALLLGVCERAWFTAPPSDRALSPAALQSLARQLGFEAAVCEPSAWRALKQARRWAQARGGVVLVTGSVYLVGDLLGRLGEQGDTLERPTSVVDRVRR